MSAQEAVGHTPGPWEQVKHGSKRRVRPVSDARLTVAHVPIGYMTNDLANARLIAAAPDLLTALRAAVAAQDPLKCSSWVANALAAIAKAGGQHG